MGIQSVRDVDLIRHAYVLPVYQGMGIGAALTNALRARAAGHLLVGTWAAATWAIGFYQRHGFRIVPGSMKTSLLRAYWPVSARQIETSVVLAAARLNEAQASELMKAAQA